MFIVLVGMLLYGIVHSWLAGQHIKNRVRNHIGDRAYHGLYRISYNLFALISIAPVVLLIPLHPGGRVWSLGTGWQLPLLIIQSVGAVGLIASLFQIDLLRFLGLRQLMAYLRGEPLPLPDEKLKTSGVYRVVRHPLYLFSLMLIWPMMNMSEAYFGFCVGATIYFLIGSIYEERRMVHSFGEEYTQYQARVPWMLPRFGNKS